MCCVSASYKRTYRKHNHCRPEFFTVRMQFRLYTSARTELRSHSKELGPTMIVPQPPHQGSGSVEVYVASTLPLASRPISDCFAVRVGEVAEGICSSRLSGTSSPLSMSRSAPSCPEANADVHYQPIRPPGRVLRVTPYPCHEPDRQRRRMKKAKNSLK